MNLLSRAACIAGLVASTFGAANAATVVNDWYFNPNGTGLASATTIHEGLDFTGQGFIDITPTGGTSFSFTETAAFRVSTYDGLTALPTPNFITAYFVASGTGNFSGAFTFNGGGKLFFYSDAVDDLGSTNGVFGANNGTLIGTFDVLAGGGGLVDGSGNPTGNGQVSVNLKAAAGSLANGYWFDPSGQALNSTLAFAFTNANGIQSPSVTTVKELACEGAGYNEAGGFCPSGIYNAGGPANNRGDLFVGNNGQFKLAIPEPTSVALIGLALVAAGVSRRRAAVKA